MVLESRITSIAALILIDDYKVSAAASAAKAQLFLLPPCACRFGTVTF